MTMGSICERRRTPSGHSSTKRNGRFGRSGGRPLPGTSLAAQTSARRFLCFQWLAPRFMASDGGTVLKDPGPADHLVEKHLPRLRSLPPTVGVELRCGNRQSPRHNSTLRADVSVNPIQTTAFVIRYNHDDGDRK